MLITATRHLRLVLDEHIDHYDEHRLTGCCNRARLPGVRIRLLQA